MTPDECFDAMAKVLGLPQDTGYIKLLEDITKLKEENAELDEVKQEVEDWKDSCSGYVETPDELEMWMSAAIHEDEEEYSKYMEPLELRDEVVKLGEQIAALRGQTCCNPGEKLEDRIGELIEYKNKYRAEVAKLKEKDKQWTELMKGAMSSGLTGKVEKLAAENEKLKEENEKLAETADETPDCCCDCDKRFDLDSHMNCGDCSKDGKQIHIAQMYDHYFGGPDDNGDICADCLITRWPEIGAGFPVDVA